MEDREQILILLDRLNPTSLNYEEWLQVGMAMVSLSLTGISGAKPITGTAQKSAS